MVPSTVSPSRTRIGGTRVNMSRPRPPVENEQEGSRSSLQDGVKIVLIPHLRRSYLCRDALMRDIPELAPEKVRVDALHCELVLRGERLDFPHARIVARCNSA